MERPRATRSLRFAQALALLGGLGGCGAAPASSPPPPARPPVETHAARCARCTCDGASVNPPYCDAREASGCCPHVRAIAIPGPLAPPDLPASMLTA